MLSTIHRYKFNEMYEINLIKLQILLIIQLFCQKENVNTQNVTRLRDTEK